MTVTHDGDDRGLRFGRLVCEHQDAVLRTCFLYLCDRTMAEDASQETFLRAWRAVDTFRGESSEKTWLMKIAARVCYDMNRSAWFRMINRRVTPDMLPEPAADADSRDEALTLAVMRLPRRLREAVVLYYYQGMTVVEIADALSISHAAVSGRLKRGRERLKTMMKGDEQDARSQQ